MLELDEFVAGTAPNGKRGVRECGTGRWYIPEMGRGCKFQGREPISLLSYGGFGDAYPQNEELARKWVEDAKAAARVLLAE